MLKKNDIEFETGEKKFPIMEFLVGFLAWIGLTTTTRKGPLKFSTEHAKEE